VHILIIPSWYRTKEKPVHGSFFAEQAEALARAGHKVTVMPYYADADKGWHVETLERRDAGDLTEHAVHYRRMKFHLTYLRIVWAMLWVMRRLLRGEKPDIIHVHSFRATAYARALRLFTGIPYVVTEHGTWFERGMLSEKDKKTARRGFSRADAVYAVSPGLKEVLAPYCLREIQVIPNLVAERFFTGGLRQEPGEVFRFISVGTLEYKKGQDVLIRAFARVAGEEPKVSLTIVGEGPYYEPLHQWARELGVEDKVELTWMISREEVARRLRESQVFVLPSRTETFGVVFIEAMACGVPIVMTRTNAWELLVRPETGLAVEIDDEDGLTAAMLDILRRYGDYDPHRIAESCRARFSEEAVAAQLTAAYEDVLRQKEGKAHG